MDSDATPAEVVPAVAVIILSYNGMAETIACIDSLLEDTVFPISIVVVDNASTPAAIRERFPDIHLLELPENRGWAGGNNAGIASALRDGAEFICLLNNDTIVPRGAIARLTHTARRFRPCLLHPAIDFMDPAEGVQLDPRCAEESGCRPLPEDPDVFELNFAYGACLMIPTKVFQCVGLFDERFFLQMEETDFWMRAQKIGIRSLCDTGTRIIHAESQSFGGRMTPTKTYYIVRNTLLLAEKHSGTPVGMVRALRSIYWFAAKLAQQNGSAASVIRWWLSNTAHSRAGRAAIADYCLRRFGRMSSAARQAIEQI
jgi:GT2 family glycosyltransferase